MYYDLYLGGKALVERENMGFDLTKSDIYPSFIEDLTAKGVGLRVVDSHTGNHREDGFTPLETIQRFLEGKIIIHFPFTMNAKDIIHVQTCELTKEEFAHFLKLYPVPSEYSVMLPKRNQTIFDTLDGYVRPDPFGCAKLTTFIIMCKLYGCKPSIDVFRGFFNSIPGGKWLTFAKRPEKHVPNLLPKVITRIEGWKGRFFFVQDTIVPANCHELLSKDNGWNTKSFGDKLPDNIHKNPFFQRLGRHPTSVRVFPDPILFMAGLKPSWEHGQQRPTIIVDGKEIAFRNFMYAKTDKDLSFLLKEPSPDFGTGSPPVSINMEPPIGDAESVVQLVENTTDSRDSSCQGEFVIHLGSVATRIKYRKCKTRGGSSRPPMKRKLTQAVVDNAVNRRSWELLKVIEQIRGQCDLMKEIKRATNEECEGLKAKCEAAMMDFDSNLTVVALHKKISTLSSEAKEHKANLDRMMLESKKWAGYQVSLSTLETKVAFLEAEKARLETVEESLRQEVDDLKRDRMEVFSKVVPYIVMELVHSDELGRLVGKLVSSAVFYGRCDAFKEVVKMKDPFDLTKVKGYRPFYKKEHIKAGNDLTTATFPFLSEVVKDPLASIETLLSKKPPTL
ncbi:hypothetical protein Tco_0540240 [Tanacetum coccineum]